MSSYGSYVKAIRKASTHLTEEPFSNTIIALKSYQSAYFSPYFIYLYSSNHPLLWNYVYENNSQSIDDRK